MCLSSKLFNNVSQETLKPILLGFGIYFIGTVSIFKLYLLIKNREHLISNGLHRFVAYKALHLRSSSKSVVTIQQIWLSRHFPLQPASIPIRISLLYFLFPVLVMKNIFVLILKCSEQN